MATRFNGGIIGVRNSTTVGLTTGRFSSNEVLLSLKDGTWPIPPVNLTVPVVTGTAQDALIPIPVFICSKCGEVLEETLPLQLKNKE